MITPLLGDCSLGSTGCVLGSLIQVVDGGRDKMFRWSLVFAMVLGFACLLGNVWLSHTLPSQAIVVVGMHHKIDVVVQHQTALWILHAFMSTKQLLPMDVSSWDNHEFCTPCLL